MTNRTIKYILRKKPKKAQYGFRSFTYDAKPLIRHDDEPNFAFLMPLKRHTALTKTKGMLLIVKPINSL